MEASLCPQSPKCCGSHRHQAVQSQGSSIRGEAGGHVLRDVGSFGTVPPKGLGEMRVGRWRKAPGALQPPCHCGKRTLDVPAQLSFLVWALGWVPRADWSSSERIQVSWPFIRPGPSGLPGVPEPGLECGLLSDAPPRPLGPRLSGEGLQGSRLL